MLKTLTRIIVASTILSSIAVPSIADDSEILARMEALSYAPEGYTEDDRFSQFEFETEEYAEHELNDAWLGMPAYSSNGKLIGYVDDAIMDSGGYVTELAVGLNEQQVLISISGEYAELTDKNVQLELSNKQIAELASTNKLASLN